MNVALRRRRRPAWWPWWWSWLFSAVGAPESAGAQEPCVSPV